LSSNPTYPHDYRVFCASAAQPIVVGGQAVNLWAITFLADSSPVSARSEFSSVDLDVLANPSVLAFLEKLPAWTFAKTPIWAFGESIRARAFGLAPDGRKLLVEVLHSVMGLDKADLAAVATVTLDGVNYRTLDPIAMLKAKAVCVRDLDQNGPPLRHDRRHLQLVARCLPHFLTQIHAEAIASPQTEVSAAKIFSRAFALLADKRIAPTLHAERIDFASLLPPEFAESPVARIRAAYHHQIPRLGLPAFLPQPASFPAPVSPAESVCPHLLLLEKLSAFAGTATPPLSDSLAVAALLTSLRERLHSLHAAVLSGEKSATALVSLLDKTSAALSSPQAADSSKTLGLSFNSIVSPQLLLSPHPEVRLAAENASASIASHTWHAPASSIVLDLPPRRDVSRGHGLLP